MICRPSSTIIVGTLGCGKTALTESLLSEGKVFQGPWRPFYYCYGEVWQPRFDTMKKRGVHFHAELQDVADLQRLFGPTQGGVLVLDDELEEVRNNKTLLDLFTKESHHRGITVLHLCQHLFPPS